MRFIVSLLVFSAILVFEFSLDVGFAFTLGYLKIYLSIKYFIFILLPTIAFLYYSRPEKGTSRKNVLKMLLRRMDEVSEPETKQAMSLFRAVGNFILFLSGIFMILAFFVLLMDLSDASKIGPGMAEVVVPLFWGVVGKTIFFAAEQRLSLLYLKHSQ